MARVEPGNGQSSASPAAISAASVAASNFGSRRSVIASQLKHRLKNVALALLPLSVYVTGALAVDRIITPAAVTSAGEPNSSAASPRVARLQRVVWRDERNLIEAAPDRQLLDRLPTEPTIENRAAATTSPHRVAMAVRPVLAQSVETQLALALEASAGLPVGSYLILRGVPAGATLSHGISIGPDVWLVDATEVDRLSLRMHHAQVATYSIALQWVTLDGHLLAQDNLTLESRPLANPDQLPTALASLATIRASSPAIELPRADDEPTQPKIKLQLGAAVGPKVAAHAGSSAGLQARNWSATGTDDVTGERSQATTSSTTTLTMTTGPETASTLIPEDPQAVRKAPIDPKAVEAMLARGRRMIELANFAVARPLLERAARDGSAAAAMLIAGTYDPSWLGSNGAIGVTPDAAKARHWYEEALRLGAADAGKRLAALGRD